MTLSGFLAVSSAAMSTIWPEGPGGPPPAAPSLAHPSGDGWCQRRVASRHGADGVDDVLGRRILEQEAAGAGAQRLESVFVEIEGGQDEDPRRGLDGDDAPGRLEPVDARHADVQDRHGRPEAPHQADGLGTVGTLADDAQVGLAVEDHPQPGAGQRLIVGDDDVDGHDDPTANGRVASTRNPPPDIGPARNEPSYTWTRSRMPMRPCPDR